MSRRISGNKAESEAYGGIVNAPAAQDTDGGVKEVPLAPLGFSQYEVGMQGQPAEAGMEGQLAQANQLANGTYSSFGVYDDINEGISGEGEPMAGPEKAPAQPPEFRKTRGG